MSAAASRRPSPYQLLGLRPGASDAEVRAARRRLAREHHPDRFAGDPAAARAATRQMAHINAAAEALLGEGEGRAGARAGRDANGGDGEAPRGGHRPAAPVTGRVVVDAAPRANARTSERTAVSWREASWRPRDNRARRGPLVGTPAGPVERRVDETLARAPRISIAEARALIFPFGRYAGATVGEIARRDPGYLAWCVDNVRRDPVLVRAADLLLDEAVTRHGVRRPARGSLRRESPVAFDASESA